MTKIIQYKNGIPIKKYKTAYEIEKKKGYSRGHISECLNKKRKTAYGYEWKYQMPRRKGRLKYWFKSKNEAIKDVGFLADQCEKYEKEIENLRKEINELESKIRNLKIEKSILLNERYQYYTFGVR